jgi:hypothetical protein
VLGPLAQLVNREVTRSKAVIAISLFIIAPHYANGVPRDDMMFKQLIETSLYLRARKTTHRVDSNSGICRFVFGTRNRCRKNFCRRSVFPQGDRAAVDETLSSGSEVFSLTSENSYPQAVDLFTAVGVFSCDECATEWA